MEDLKNLTQKRQQALDKELKRVKGLAAKTYGQKENNIRS